MLNDSMIWFANDQNGSHINLKGKMANRHGFVSGATGTGKTVTLKVLAESFSQMGVPVFISDVKGDVLGISKKGDDSEDMQNRITRFGLAENGFQYQGFPVSLWDVYGRNGIQLRTTVSEMGPLLLSRILELNDLQTDILNVVFKIADDNGLILTDIKDLKAILSYIDTHSADFAAEYGKISSSSIGVIVRGLVALEAQGADQFFGEPALNITDWLNTENGKGVINILDATELYSNGKLYSTFLLWLVSELFESLPEVGDLDKPKLVFFFDEAHLLFKNASNVLIEKTEQLVKLIRSKGVGIYFCTQNPRDIPNSILTQLGNKIQHGLRAYTEVEVKNVKAAAEAFRSNPDFNTYETLLELGTGEALVSVLGDDGVPSVVQKASILPPQSNFGTISDSEKDNLIKGSLLYSKYANSYDPETAYEVLKRKGIEDAETAENERLMTLEEKEKAKAQAKEEKEREKEAASKKKATARAVKSVGNSVVGTVGRELGKQVGSTFGSFGKRLGGNLGASLGRGLFGTLFRK